MVGEADLALDAQALRLGLHAVELDAGVGLVEVDAVEHPKEIEVPPGAAELAVGRKLEADLLLLLDDLLDFPVFDRLELGRRDGALFVLGAGLLERRGAQEAADMIGAVGRLGSFHCKGSLGQLTASKGTPAKPPSTTKRRRIVPPERWDKSHHGTTARPEIRLRALPAAARTPRPAATIPPRAAPSPGGWHRVRSTVCASITRKFAA